MKNKLATFFKWFFSIFCLSAIFIYGISLGSILMTIIGIIALPIKPIKELWVKITKDKQWIKITSLTVLFITAIMFLPDVTDSTNSGIEDTSTTEISSTLANNSEQTTINETSAEESTTNEINSSVQESTTKKETTTAVVETTTMEQTTTQHENLPVTNFSLSDVPAYSGKPYVVINNNVPFFTKSELTTKSYEFYSNLDDLGRCGVTYACIGQDIMPTEERGNIGQVKPSGWHTVKYDIVDGKYLYNRCHLIGYQLTGENANTKNLITGTRSMNVDGMLPFENMVADYIKETNNHVMYRVTPMFNGNNLLADGVLMEAISVEDNGDGVLFNVFVYNAQPGIKIDYATGNSSLQSETTTKQPTTTTTQQTTNPKEETTTKQSSNEQHDITYILNTNTKKFHYSDCSYVDSIKEKNYDTYTGDREDLIDKGYEACKRCHP